MKVIIINPQIDPLWRKFVEANYSDVFHSPEWMSVLADTYDFEVCAVMLVDEKGKIKAALPFVRIADIRGLRLVTLPFSDYCDPLVKHPDHWHKLTNPLLTPCYPFTIRCLHNSLPLADDRLTLVNRAKWHGLDLRPNLETVWQGLQSSARQAIKKAQRNGLVVRPARVREELRAFFELHLGVRKNKYRLLAQPYRFFENIWDRFIDKQKGTLMVAFYRDELVGGVLFLEWQGKLYYKFNASNSAFNSLRPNDLITWEGIQYGKSKGCTYLDFGLTDYDQEGLLQYKRKYATEEKTISFLRYAPNSEPSPQAQQMQDLLPYFTELFTEASVPDRVTEQAGEVLYKLFA